MIEIKPNEDFFSLDKNGFIINETNKKNIKEPWLSVIEDYKKVYNRNPFNNIHSLYLRGSVPKGTAIEYISDIDFLIVVFDDQKLQWMESFIPYIENKYKFITKVEITNIKKDYLFNFNTENKFLKFSSKHNLFLLKTQCLWICGDNLIPQINNFKPNQEIAFTAIKLKVNLDFIFDRLKEGISPEEQKIAISFISKYFLRSGFEICIEQEKKYTRDLYTCYKVFSKYYPEKELYMYKALELAINPTLLNNNIIEFINNFGFWLVNKIKEKGIPTL